MVLIYLAIRFKIISILILFSGFSLQGVTQVEGEKMDSTQQAQAANEIANSNTSYQREKREYQLSETSKSKNETEWEDWFMPGFGYKVFSPKNSDSLGTYKGYVTEFVIYAKARKGESKWGSGPSRVKTYGNLAILASDKDGVKDIFYANLGLNLSFEGKSNRNYLLPYFGIETGGMFQRDFSSYHFTPVGGLQIISTKKLLWNVQMGYQYTTRYFDEFSGVLALSSLNFLLWNK